MSRTIFGESLKDYERVRDRGRQQRLEKFLTAFSADEKMYSIPKTHDSTSYINGEKDKEEAHIMFPVGYVCEDSANDFIKICKAVSKELNINFDCKIENVFQEFNKKEKIATYVVFNASFITDKTIEAIRKQIEKQNNSSCTLM